MNALMPMSSSALPNDPVMRLTAAHYQEMLHHGILSAADGVELLEGWLVKKTPESAAHAFATALVSDQLEAALSAGWHVRHRPAITTNDSEPEPDLAIVRGVARNSSPGRPNPAEVAMVVEIADRSLDRDRTLKLRTYARAGIPAYWIVNLSERTVEAFTLPSGPADVPTYRQRIEVGIEDAVPLSVPGSPTRSLRVINLLP